MGRAFRITVTGNDADKTITISRNTLWAILVNYGAVPIQNGPDFGRYPIEIYGRGGNDFISGSKPGGLFHGGAGD